MTTNVTPCIVVDGASQSIPGATGQNADRCFYCLFPVRALHQPIDNLQKKFTQLKLITQLVLKNTPPSFAHQQKHSPPHAEGHLQKQ